MWPNPRTNPSENKYKAPRKISSITTNKAPREHFSQRKHFLPPLYDRGKVIRRNVPLEIVANHANHPYRRRFSVWSSVRDLWECPWMEMKIAFEGYFPLFGEMRSNMGKLFYAKLWTSWWSKSQFHINLIKQVMICRIGRNGSFPFFKIRCFRSSFSTSILHLINLLRVIAESQSIKVRESPLMGEKSARDWIWKLFSFAFHAL